MTPIDPSQSEITASWICPEDEEYGFYQVREGSFTTLRAGSTWRCAFRNIHGNEDDFEVTLRADARGLSLMFDYDGVPTTLPFKEFAGEGERAFIHRSAQHFVCLLLR